MSEIKMSDLSLASSGFKTGVEYSVYEQAQARIKELEQQLTDANIKGNNYYADAMLAQVRVKELEAMIETFVEVEKISTDTINNWAKRYNELTHKIDSLADMYQTFDTLDGRIVAQELRRIQG